MSRDYFGRATDLQTIFMLSIQSWKNWAVRLELGDEKNADGSNKTGILFPMPRSLYESETYKKIVSDEQNQSPFARKGYLFSGHYTMECNARETICKIIMDRPNL